MGLYWLGLLAFVCVFAVPVIAAIILAGRLDEFERRHMEELRRRHG